MQSSAALRDLISQTANPDFQDTSFLIKLALKYDWLRDALASFSAHQDNCLRDTLAPNLYQNAVSSLRSHLNSAQIHGGSVELLGAIIFIGMSDSLGTGDPARAIVHFQAAASICKTFSFASLQTQEERMLYRIAAECWLYHLSTLCLFHRDCDGIMRCIDWTVLDECFDEPVSGTCISLDTSPFLGGSQSVYKLIMQVTWYARQDRPLKNREQQKLIWSTQLDVMQGRPRAYFHQLPDNVAQLYYSKFMLHIYALRIVVEKIADHTMRNSAPLVCYYLKEAQTMLTASSNYERKNPALAWPLIIFLCAADRVSTFNYFVDTIGEISENFDEGHMRRMNEVLDTIRKQREGALCGLDLLLRKRGIFIPDS